MSRPPRHKWKITQMFGNQFFKIYLAWILQRRVSVNTVDPQYCLKMSSLDIQLQHWISRRQAAQRRGFGRQLRAVCFPLPQVTSLRKKHFCCFPKFIAVAIRLYYASLVKYQLECYTGSANFHFYMTTLFTKRLFVSKFEITASFCLLNY